MEIRDLAKEAVLISEDSSFRDAVALMVRKQTNSLLVINDDGELSGEVKMSDLLDAIVPISMNADKIETALGSEEAFADAVKDAGDKTVADFMTPDVQPVRVDDPLINIVATAIAHQTAHIPIVDHDNHPIGVISRRGIKHILAKYLGIKE